MLSLVKKMLMGILTSSRNSDFNATATATAAADDEYDDLSSLSEALPEDVKEGHFVVHTIDHGEPKRFIVELSSLAHPGFMKLLKQAEEEFGFKQAGVLAVPCGPNELLKILENQKEGGGNGGCNSV